MLELSSGLVLAMGRLIRATMLRLRSWLLTLTRLTESLRGPATLGSRLTTIQLERVGRGTPDIGLVRHMQVRIGSALDITAAVTTAAIGVGGS